MDQSDSILRKFVEGMSSCAFVSKNIHLTHCLKMVPKTLTLYLSAALFLKNLHKNDHKKRNMEKYKLQLHIFLPGYFCTKQNENLSNKKNNTAGKT